MTTEIIDKLFLELSQITTAKTARELQLESICQQLVQACQRVATEHQMYAPHSNDQYQIGVIDGHRCAASMVRDVLQNAIKARSEE